MAYDDRFALVCSYDQARIHMLDAVAGRLSGEVETGLRPVRLVFSTKKSRLISLQQLSRQVDLSDLSLPKGDPTLKRIKTLDLGEVIVDGAFSGDNTFYFVSSEKPRVFGLDLVSGKAFWAMRTGGVRAPPAKPWLGSTGLLCVRCISGRSRRECRWSRRSRSS